MTNNNLMEILNAEIELSEALAKALDAQTRAIVRSDIGQLEGTHRQIESLVNPLQALETERLRVVSKRQADGDVGILRKESFGHPLGRRTASVEDQEREKTNQQKLLDTNRRLKRAAIEVQAKSEQNRLLLQHSLRFVNESVRLLTDNYSVQLVDRRW